MVNSIDALDNIEDVNKLLKVGNVSKDVAKEAIDLTHFADSIDDIGDAIDGLPDGVGAINKLKLVFNGLVTLIKPLIPAILAVSAAIAAFKIWDYSQHGFTRAQEDAEKASSEYKEVQTSLQNLNSELETTQKRISELQALKDAGNISFAEEAELEGLQRQNEELERQRDIQESLLEVKQKASAQAAKNASKAEISYTEQMEKEHGKVKGKFLGFLGSNVQDVNDPHVYGETISADERWKSKDTTIQGQVKENVSSLKDYSKQLKDLENQMKDDPTNKIFIEAQADLQNKINDTTTALSEQSDTIQGWIDASVDSNGIITPGSEDAVREWKNILLEIQGMDLTPKQKQLKQIENAFNGSKTSSAIKDQLLEMVKLERESFNATDALHSLGITLTDLGITGDGAKATFDRYFDEMIQSAYEAGDAIKGIDGSVEGVKKAFETENQDADWSSMADLMDKANGLFNEHKIGTDDLKAAAQFMTKDIINPDGDGFEYDAEAYAEAWKNAQAKVKRYFDKDNPITSALNFQNDLIDKGLGSKSGDDIKWTEKFKTSADAAKELGLSIQATEVLMHNLESYGAEFDNVFFSGENLDKYNKSLSGLKEIYDSMDSNDAGKARLKKLFDSGAFEDLGYFEEHLDELTEDKIIKIQFEYDLAQLQQKENELDEQWENGNKSSEVGGSRIAAKSQTREFLEKETGYDETNADVGYKESYDQIASLQKEFNKKLTDDQRAAVQNQIAGIEDLQSAFQIFRKDGGQLDWNNYLNSEEGKNVIAEIEDALNIDFDDFELKVDADTSEAKDKIEGLSNDKEKVIKMRVDATDEQIKRQLDELESGQELHFTANVDGVEQQVEAVKHEGGVITYTATNLDGVQTQVIAVLHEDGTITYEPITNAVDAETAKTDGGIRKTVYFAETSGLPTWFEPITRTVKYVASKIFGGGDGELTGTAHANGTAGLYPIPKLSGRALAMGTLEDSHLLKSSWKTQKDEVALTGEKGVEIVAHGNRWWTVGDDGAEFTHIPQGSVVFNAEQSKKLLKDGHINGRGRSYLSGTAYGNGMPSIGSTGGTGYSSGGKDKYRDDNKDSKKSADKEVKSFMEQMKEYFDKFVDWIEVRLNYLDRKLSKAVDKFKSPYKFDSAGNDLKSALSLLQQSINETKAAKDRYWVQANLVAGKVGLSSDLQQRVQTGAIDINEYDEETKQKIEMYQSWYEKIKKCEDALDDLAEQQSELLEANFDKVLKNYDNQLEQLSHQQEMIDKAISLTEAKGHLVGESYYKELIKLEGDNLSKLTEEYNSLQTALNDAMNTGKIERYSSAWYEMTNDINSVEEAISDAKLEMQEFENTLRDLQWGNFDYLVDKIQESVDEADFLVDLLGRKDLFDDNGILTKEGMSTLGQYSVKYNIEMGKSDKYKEEIDKINESLKIDPFNKDLLERRKELIKLQQESIKNAEDEKEAMIDLIKEGVEKQIDAMQKLIDAKVEALNKEKDLYSYQKEIAEKTKRLNDLEKQYNSLLGDDSEENIKTIQDLKNQISEARTDLQETEYDKYISDQKDLLDELIQNYEDTLNEQFDNIGFLIDSLMGIVNDNSADINDTITSATEDVGYTITDELQSIWNSNSGLSSIVSSYSAHFDTHATTVQEYLKSINLFMQQMAAKAEEEAKANMSSKPAQSQPNSPSIGNSSNSNTNNNSSASNGGGDGVPRVGDSVTFTNGKYFYDSYGKAPAGSKYMGQTVYITKINGSGSKPYHISTGTSLGKGDLGWVTLDQLKGYKSGIKNVPYDQYAWTQEGAPETIVRKYDGSVLTKLGKGDAVYKAKATENLWNVANDPSGFIAQYQPLQKYTIPDLKPLQQAVNIDVGGIGDVVLSDVQNPKEFADTLVRTVQTDSRVQRVMQGATTDLLGGKSKFAVRRY